MAASICGSPVVPAVGPEASPDWSGRNWPLPARGHGHRARLASRAGWSEVLLRLSWHPPLEPYRADNGRQQDGAGGHQSHQGPTRHGYGTLPATAVSKHRRGGLAARPASRATSVVAPSRRQTQPTARRAPVRSGRVGLPLELAAEVLAEGRQVVRLTAGDEDIG